MSAFAHLRTFTDLLMLVPNLGEWRPGPFVPAVLTWGGYAMWVALFAVLSWRGKVRLLVTLGVLMLLAFGVLFWWVQSKMASTNYDRSGDMGAGLLLVFGAAVLIAPLLVAAIAYPIGRVWAR